MSGQAQHLCGGNAVVACQTDSRFDAHLFNHVCGFGNDFLYIKITAKAVRKLLIEQKGYKSEELPSENTIGNMLNRMGYSLKRVLKAKPIKKFPKPMRYLKMSGK